MRFRHIQLGMLLVLVILCLAMNWMASTRQNLPQNHDIPAVVIERAHEKCPPCELFFRKLESTGRNGKLVQEVKVQQRGEPKSGTSFMYDWATATLLRTCDYLKYLFGEDSCRIEFKKKVHGEQLLGRAANRRMVFQPMLGGHDSRCSCETIERVSIELSDSDKHTLPVNAGCAYSHGRGIDFGPIRNGVHHDKSACNFADGRPIASQDDLWQCMHEARCQFVDDWLQMVVFRDPRPAVVSSYFHLKRLARTELPSLEEFVAKKLPIMCQWLAVRYTLFSGSLAHQSTEFWYRKALANPLGWHHTWFDMVGLQLPFDLVNDTANGAVNYDFAFNKKHIDEHPGEEAGTVPGSRLFKDQVSEAVLNTADEVLRVWLPPVLLEQLGVEPRQQAVSPPHLTPQGQPGVAQRQQGLPAAPPQREVAPPQLAAAQRQPGIAQRLQEIAPPQKEVAPPQLAAAQPKPGVAQRQQGFASPQIKVPPPQLAAAQGPPGVAQRQQGFALPQKDGAPPQLAAAQRQPQPGVAQRQHGFAIPQKDGAPPQLAGAQWQPQPGVAQRQQGFAPPQKELAPPQLAAAQQQPGVVQRQQGFAPPQRKEAPPQLAAAQRQPGVAKHQPGLSPQQREVAPPKLAAAQRQPGVAKHQPGLSPLQKEVVPPQLAAAQQQPGVEQPQRGLAPPQREVVPPQLAAAQRQLGVAQPKPGLASSQGAVALIRFAEAPPKMAAAPRQRAVESPQITVEPPQVAVAPLKVALAPTGVLR